jgi:hypothetical protein
MVRHHAKTDGRQTVSGITIEEDRVALRGTRGPIRRASAGAAIECDQLPNLVVRAGWSAIGDAPSAHCRCRPTSPTARRQRRDGEKGRMFGAAEDRADAIAFAKRGLNDRHHFRSVVAPR